MPGRRLVTAQCFTNALYVGNENGLGKLQLRWRTQILPHLRKLRQQCVQAKKGWHIITDESNHGWYSSLPFYFFPSSLPSSFSDNFTLNQTFHNDTPILSKHHFFCFVIYLIFCYKTCTGCLEQQQKYNIQFICNFV